MLGTMFAASKQSECATPSIMKPFCISTTSRAVVRGFRSSNTCSRPRERTTESTTDWGMAILCMPASDGDLRHHSPPAPADKSVLCLRGAHDQSVQSRGHLDLARQTAVRLQILSEIEHLLFHILARRQLGQPFRIHIDVTRCASTGPATVGVDPGYPVLDGPFHDGPADRHIGGALGAIILDIGNFRHSCSFQIYARDLPGTLKSASRSGAMIARAAINFRPTI